VSQEVCTKRFRNLIGRTRGKLCGTLIFDHADRNVREEKSPGSSRIKILRAAFIGSWQERREKEKEKER